MKKKAYTLTELLVVVMIIAVLAAVVLPKFNKVLETRRTTEAEDLMTAIRQEQEYRCAADRPYADNMANLKSVASAKAKNYTLALTGTGVEAKRNGKSYQLSIPSYADGRICCDDINDSGLCAELNRDYPTCTELRNKADFKTSPEDCAPPQTPQPTPQCSNGAKEYADCSNSCGMSGTRLVNECVGGVWQVRNGSCSVTDASCSCNAVSGDKPADRQETCNKCGTRTVTYNCGGAPNWQWVSSAGACSVEAGHCPCDDGDKPSTEQSCSSCGGKQTRSVTCNDGSWITGDWSTCDRSEEQCDACYHGEEECAYIAGNWSYETCTCSCTDGNRDGCSPDKAKCRDTRGHDYDQSYSQCVDSGGSWSDKDCYCACPYGMEVDNYGSCNCIYGSNKYGQCCIEYGCVSDPTSGSFGLP